MKAIVITRKLSTKEIDTILKNFGDDTIIYRKNTLPDFFQKKYKSIIISEDENQKKRINYDTLKEVLSFGETTFKGKAITDYLMIENISIWHLHKFRIYFSLRNLVYEIEFLKEIQKTHTEMHYFGNYNKQISLNLNNITVYPPEKKSKLLQINYFQTLQYFLFFTIRIFLSYVYRRNKIKPTQKHLIIDHAIRQTIINITTLKKEKGNYNLAYLFNKMDNSFLILDDVNLPELKPSYHFNFQKGYFSTKNKIYGESILLNGFINKNIRKKIFGYQQEITKKIKRLKKEEYSNTQLIIISLLENYSKSSFIYLLKYFSYDYFFKNNNIEIISTIDENSPRISSILSAAKKNRVITVGIQHGAIHELHPAYMFTKQDITRKITTDHTLVFGKYWSELLIKKGNYSPKSIHITGQIRTDIIPKLLYKNTNHDATKKIILYASQMQRDPELRKKAAKDVFKAVKNIKNAFLIIKLHPSEKNDVKYYDNIAKTIGIEKYRIVYWEDLYLLLSKSDIIVTCFSTVGAEAVYFKKPLVILDHLKQDLQHYHKEGVAFMASDASELENYFRKIISGNLTINKRAYDNFIANYAYKIDGKTSERVIHFIKLIEDFNLAQNGNLSI